ncbi:hypothetical protein GOP47_0026116 [Adiantum capillus-veneris]|uniref:Uncharacterized protein n=1 Tax=Adiantum capillus-veneris TaxID=13818 RepID=A0A9D4Z469_ADICA|nr:hypothetical protein GOP47_0026116 [Adiantum capillus-veneris]
MRSTSYCSNLYSLGCLFASFSNYNVFTWNLMLRGLALAALYTEDEQKEEYWFAMSPLLPCDERIWSFRAFSSQEWAFFGLPLPGCSQGKLFNLLGGMGCSLLPQLEDTFYVGRCRPRLVSPHVCICAQSGGP